MQIALLVLKILLIIFIFSLLIVMIVLLLPLKYKMVLTYSDEEILINIKYLVFNFDMNIHIKKPIKIFAKLNKTIIVDTTKKNKKTVDNKKLSLNNEINKNNFIKNLQIKKFVTESKEDIAKLFNRAKEYQYQLINEKEKKKFFINGIKDFILDKVSKLWPKKAIKQLKPVLNELNKVIPTILPKKVDMNLKIGFKDPFYTGIALAILSPVYSIFGKKMNVIPSFRKEEITGTIIFIGHTILIIPFISIIRLLLNKEFREFLFNKKKNRK